MRWPSRTGSSPACSGTPGPSAKTAQWARRKCRPRSASCSSRNRKPVARRLNSPPTQSRQDAPDFLAALCICLGLLPPGNHPHHFGDLFKPALQEKARIPPEALHAQYEVAGLRLAYCSVGKVADVEFSRQRDIRQVADVADHAVNLPNRCLAVAPGGDTEPLVGTVRGHFVDQYLRVVLDVSVAPGREVVRPGG